MKPKSLELKNFQSHKHSYIDFNKFDVAVILGAHNNNSEESNGAGKSSLIEAIRWALFDKNRHKKKDGVVKRDSSVCIVVFEFEVSNKLYRITRKRNKSLGESTVSLQQFYKDKGEFVNIDCDTDTATNAKITEIIGFDYDVFEHSVFFEQGDISAFTKASPSKRKDVLQALLKLNQWEQYEKKTKKYISGINTELAEKSGRAEDIDELRQCFEECQNDISVIEKQIADKNSHYETLNEDLSKKQLQLASIPEDGASQLAELRREYSTAKKRLREIQTAIQENNNSSKRAKDYIKKADNWVKELNSQVREKDSLDLSTARQGLTKGKNRVRVLKEKIRELSREVGDECEHCFREIRDGDIDKIKQNRAEKLEELEGEYKRVSSKLRSSERKFKQMEGVYNAGVDAEIKRERVKAKRTAAKTKLQGFIDQNKALRAEMHEIQERDYDAEIRLLQEQCDDSTRDNLVKSIAMLKEKLNVTKTGIDELNVELGNKRGKVTEYEARIKEQTELETERDELKEKLRIYEKLKGVFGKNGVQSVIMENVVDELENHANSILSKICNEPTSIGIKMQRQTDNGSWLETFDITVRIGNYSDDFGSLSGGEQFRISFALRLAMSKILSKRMGGEVKFLLLDEVSSSLDKKGLRMFADIVKHLGSDMKVMIITHDNRLKNLFDDAIMVEKSVEGSTAKVQ